MRVYVAIVTVIKLASYFCGRMPKKRSRAEIQRDYRQRRDADPQRREVYLQQRHDKYIKDLQSGKRKVIGNMNERESRRQRREWNNRQRKSRLKSRITDSHTPPPSPLEFVHQSRQKDRGRAVLKRDRSAAYRRIKQLELELDNAKRKAEKYRKRYQRQRVGGSCKTSSETPRTKTRRLLANFHRHKKSVTKVLTFHYALVDGIRHRYQETTEERHKRVFTRLVSNQVIRRYKLATMTSEQCGIPAKKCYKRAAESVPDFAAWRRKSRNAYAKTELLKTVANFFTRDDVSRISAGKKETVTQNKLKKQKRLLTDSLRNLHMKFCSENRTISYSLFCRLRPFWVLPPSERDRDTCRCRVHDNLQFVVDKLHSLSLLHCTSIERLCESISCDIHNKNCMYGMCSSCRDARIGFVCEHVAVNGECCTCPSDGSTVKLKRFDANAIVSCPQWVSKTESHNNKQSVVVVKEAQEMPLYDLVERFHSTLSRIKRHVYNIWHQYRNYRNLRDKLTDEDCLIQIDFSENYLCRYGSEIQATHFGGSHKQATLHTGILYVGQQEPVCFCTISDSRNHDPVAIWEYMKPVLVDLKQDHPGLKTIHFFTDGPVTQYRQKKIST